MIEVKRIVGIEYITHDDIFYTRTVHRYIVGDIVRVSMTPTGKLPIAYDGRIEEVYADHLTLDTSDKYRHSSINIPLSEIQYIEKLEDKK